VLGAQSATSGGKELQRARAACAAAAASSGGGAPEVKSAAASLAAWRGQRGVQLDVTTVPGAQPLSAKVQGTLNPNDKRRAAAVGQGAGNPKP
jgi:hypothetical protein